MFRIEKVIGEQMLLCFRVHKEASNTHKHTRSFARLPEPRYICSHSHHSSHNDNPTEMKKYGRKMQ